MKSSLSKSMCPICSFGRLLGEFKSINQTCINQWKELTRVRNAEVRGSIPLCSTNRINDLRQDGHPAFFICHRFVTWSNRFGQILDGPALRLSSRVSVTQSHSDV